MRNECHGDGFCDTKLDTERHNRDFDRKDTTMTPKERMDKGLLYNPDTGGLLEEQGELLNKLWEFNRLKPTQVEEKEKYMKEVFAECGEDNYIELPFHANFGGAHVHFGSHIYANFNLTLVDDGHIYVGDYVQFAPNVVVATPNHPIDPGLRKRYFQYNKDVYIGDNVWIGSNSVIVPGVTIGRNTVIGAGSVVTKDIPENVVAVGNPCRVMRKVSERDREFFYKNERVDWEELKDTIVFDMDGTVLNTLEDLTSSVNYTLDKFDLPSHTVEEYRHLFGIGIRYVFENVVPDGTSDEEIDKMLPIFKEHYDKHCLDNTRPYDGILDLMRELKERGFKLAIVSNKIDSAVKELHERFFSESVDVAIGEKPGINRKPASDMVYEALKEMGSKKENAIYIGDSEVDLATASNSELSFICVLWGFRDEDFLREKGAKTFAKKPEDILKLV